MKERGRSAAYIKTELSAIRLFHDLIPDPRYRLPANDSLNLERRRFGEVDRTWTESEYEDMRQRADLQRRGDFADMLTLIRHTGLRLHECARLDTASAEGAFRSGSLTVKGKGGKGGHLAYIQRKPGGKVWITETAITEYLERATHPAKPVMRFEGETYRKRRV